MSTRLYSTTNAKVAEAAEAVDELIHWADSDAEHAEENEAKDTARDDRRRAKTLRKIRSLLEQCVR